MKLFTNASIPWQAAAGYASVCWEPDPEGHADGFEQGVPAGDGHHDDGRHYCHPAPLEDGVRPECPRPGAVLAVGSRREARTAGTLNQSGSGGGGFATLSNPPKSSVSRPSSAKYLPSKSRNGSSENKITLPAGGGSSTNIVLTINEGSDKKASLVGSLGKRSAVFKRLECNSNEDEEEDGELDVDIDDAGNGRKSPKKMASKVMLKGIEALGKRSASSGGGGGSIFSRLGEKSNQREQSDRAPAGILKKSPQQPTRKFPPKTQNVTLLKKIPAKTVTAGDDQSLSSRRRSFDRMNPDGEPAKSVSFSKRDEVFEIESHPMRFQDRELPFWASLGGGGANFPAGKRRSPFSNQQLTEALISGLFDLRKRRSGYSAPTSRAKSQPEPL